MVLNLSSYKERGNIRLKGKEGIWMICDCICGKRLAPYLTEIVPVLLRWKELNIDKDTEYILAFYLLTNLQFFIKLLLMSPEVRID